MTSLKGTGKLIRLILRRDRWLLLVVVLWLAAAPVGLADTYQSQTAAERAEYARTSGSNPTFLALYGPLHSETAGGIVAQRVGAIPLFIGLISLLFVIRHTRTEEQAGRRELLSGTVCGRHAGLTAVLSVAFLGNLLLGLLVASGLSQNLPGSGALAVGLGFAAAGWMFAALGGVAAQLTENAGGARGIAIGSLGAFLLIRLAADTGGPGNDLSWLHWLSPLGWVTELRPFADEQWWVLLLAVALTLLATTLAFAVSSRRDIGAGLLPARLGPAEASPALGGPLALAWRLHRGLLMGWLIAFTVLGGVFGGIAEGVGDMMKDNKDLQNVFSRIGGQEGLIDSYIASMMSLMGLVAAAYSIQAALRMRAEEENSRAEYLLATGVSRLRWIGGHLTFALLGPVVALAVGGLVAGLVHGANMGDVGGELPGILGAAMVQLPAVWVLSALTLALFGLLPRVTAAAWGGLALCFTLGQFGRALDFDQSVLDVSPFTHIPQVPGGDFTAEPFVWLLAVAAVLAFAGLATSRRRDMGAA
ncbi:ABC transporter permease [Streptomyces smyrnaeus]|uniref:ABC transporter permease n=1 Tax=Streptomyces smyrnaeus TaxID=1387713 RepID=A0ABS3XVQ6_9ACTN|nr:ABC transporter permease [Streptomyces smyrnaeus]MBO8199470.1 ABC transporter permease [Streptomyces smyrnaeus]